MPCTRTCDEAADHHVGDAVRGGLQGRTDLARLLADAYVSEYAKHHERCTYNDPHHSKPHCPPSPKPVTNEEVEDASSKAAKVIYRHDNAHETIVRMVHNIKEVFVSYDTAEDALVIAKEDEGQLAGERYGPSCLPTGFIEIEIHDGDVIAVWFCPHDSTEDSREHSSEAGTRFSKDEHVESRSDVTLYQFLARRCSACR